MKIPVRYNLKFYLKYSLMASATGAIVGLLVRVVPFGPIVGLIVGFIASQVAFLQYRFGSKRGDYEYSYLGEEIELAVDIKSTDFLANYRLAIAHEKDGDAEKAIHHYEQALEDERGLSEPLESFVHQQIERVQSEGPMIKPSALGLRFSSW